LKSDANPTEAKPPSSIDLLTLYRSLLRIAEQLPGEVAQQTETEYTEINSDEKWRRDEVNQHSDSADPASEVSTLQG